MAIANGNSNVRELNAPRFRVCIATGRKDRNDKEVWREIGVGFLNKGGSVTAIGDTIFGEFRFTVFELDYGEGGPDNPKAPTHGVFTARTRGNGRKDKWTQHGVAYFNQRGGFNCLVDTPAGQVKFFLFEIKQTEPASGGEIESSQPPSKNEFSDEIPF